MTYYVGDSVVLTNTFTVGGVNTDPDTVSLEITEPDGTATTYTYAAAQITRTAAGVYTKTITADSAGTWIYEWIGTGAAADTEAGVFVVEPTAAVTPGSTLDLLTLNEAKQAIDRESDTNPTFVAKLESLITAVSQALDEMCGPIVQRLITAERHAGGEPLIFLRQRPVVSITSVSEYAGGTATALTAETEAANATTNYLWDADLDVLYRRSSWTNTNFASQSVLVTYIAGRFATTAAVDARFKEAAKDTLAHLWRARHGAGTVSFGADDEAVYEPIGFFLPKRARELLVNEFRSPSLG